MALDTNRYTDFCAGDADLVDLLELAEAILLPFVVVAELRAGFAVGRHGSHNEGLLRRFLLKPGVEILFADEQTTLQYATLYRQLRGQGTPLPTNDLWIAALVQQHSLVLCTRDKHFERLPQLPRV